MTVCETRGYQGQFFPWNCSSQENDGTYSSCQLLLQLMGLYWKLEPLCCWILSFATSSLSSVHSLSHLSFSSSALSLILLHSSLSSLISYSCLCLRLSIQTFSCCSTAMCCLMSDSYLRIYSSVAADVLCSLKADPFVSSLILPQSSRPSIRFRIFSIISRGESQSKRDSLVRLYYCFALVLIL
ncbi:hypothetical protein FGO68_gene12898 [Halteria grandinella]|uniref:Uncharacterized protein n=1 Tax=Halteria grandinella TaxID=5974 RepID=A0A8J8NQS5_HALGN|nr:hypothetical protein FGO68_gene12898 [Halteria grandinella]